MFRNFFLKYSSDGTRISQKDFQAFAVYQGDEAFEQDDAAINFMKYFVRDSRRVATDEPVYFTPKEVHPYTCVDTQITISNNDLRLFRISL